MSKSQATSQISWLTLIAFGLFMLAGTLVLVWLGTPAAAKAIGQPLATLDLVPLVDAETSLSNADLEGKVAVLHFWGTWCPPCKLEFPEFVQLATRYASRDDITIVSVSCSAGPEYDVEELKRETERFVHQHAQVLPTYSDAAGMTRTQLALLWEGGAFSYPTTVLVDRDGKIAAVVQGYLEGELAKLDSHIQRLLGKAAS